MSTAGQSASDHRSPPAPTPAAGSAPPAPGLPSPLRGWLLFALFLAALGAHLYFLTRNWDSGFLIGHEFRQSQTALIAQHIDWQNNFSLRYDTPIFGKPWGAPLEWPLYEWMVVLLRRETSWPDFVAARAVSATFFYLTLPAIYLLLGQAGLGRAQRWPALALVVSCPVYIFYSRAFLMESTVLCFSVWFLFAFVQTLRTRRLHWAVLAGLGGAAAGMMKSLTFGAWVAPAACYGAWTLCRVWRERHGPNALLATIVWGCGTMIVPTVLTVWWTQFADSIKAQNPATLFLTSKELGTANYGTFSLAAHFSAETWHGLLSGWNIAIMKPWFLGACTLLGFAVAGRYRRALAIAVGLFLVPQLAIPYAYALQDYYFYAAAVFVLVALGFGMLGLLERRWPVWLQLPLLAVPFAGLWAAYFQPAGYHAMQQVWTNGRTGLAEPLRDLTPPESVLIIAGADWNAALAYQSGRRALMIANGRENDIDFIEERIASLEGEEIGAFVLAGPLRHRADLRDLVTKLTGLRPFPTFSHLLGDVYFPPRLDAQIRHDVALWGNDYADLSLQPMPETEEHAEPPIVELTPEQAAREFPNVHPAPVRYAAKFGFPLRATADGAILGAHPDARLCVPSPAGACTIRWDYGLDTAGSPHADGATDGVVFRITARAADGSARELFRRALNPVVRPEDRGVQHSEVRFVATGSETLCFETLPRATYTYDWAYWKRIEVH